MKPMPFHIEKNKAHVRKDLDTDNTVFLYSVTLLSPSKGSKSNEEDRFTRNSDFIAKSPISFPCQTTPSLFNPEKESCRCYPKMMT